MSSCCQRGRTQNGILSREKFAGVLICAVLVVWVGYSVYGKITAVQNEKVQETVMDTAAIDNYLADLNADE